MTRYWYGGLYSRRYLQGLVEFQNVRGLIDVFYSGCINEKMMAAEALGNIGDPGAAKALQKVAESDPDSPVRHALRRH